jgi:hypothetical protein
VKTGGYLMIDVNEPVTNPELVEAMNKFLIEKNSQNEAILIEKITKAHFLTPIVLEGKIENGLLKAGSKIGFEVITDNFDNSYFMAFTDWEELRKWSMEKVETLISTYEDLKSMVLNGSGDIKGFIINAYGQNFAITPDLMRYFSERNSEKIIEKDTSVLLGQPANYPHEMVNALSKFFKSHREVKRAYLFLAHKEGDENPNLLLVIDFTGEKAALFPQIATIAQDYLGEDEYIDFVPMDTDFGKDATKTAIPFYKRNRFFK